MQNRTRQVASEGLLGVAFCMLKSHRTQAWASRIFFRRHSLSARHPATPKTNSEIVALIIGFVYPDKIGHSHFVRRALVRGIEIAIGIGVDFTIDPADFDPIPIAIPMNHPLLRIAYRLHPARAWSMLSRYLDTSEFVQVTGSFS